MFSDYLQHCVILVVIVIILRIQFDRDLLGFVGASNIRVGAALIAPSGYGLICFLEATTYLISLPFSCSLGGCVCHLVSPLCVAMNATMYPNLSMNFSLHPNNNTRITTHLCKVRGGMSAFSMPSSRLFTNKIIVYNISDALGNLHLYSPYISVIQRMRLFRL